MFQFFQLLMASFSSSFHHLVPLYLFYLIGPSCFLVVVRFKHVSQFPTNILINTWIPLLSIYNHYYLYYAFVLLFLTWVWIYQSPSRREESEETASSLSLTLSPLYRSPHLPFLYLALITLLRERVWSRANIVPSDLPIQLTPA